MQIVTRASGLPLSDAMTEFLHRRLHFAFDRVGETVRRVVVRLSDVNGDRGGIDKRCHLQVQLQRMPDVLIEDVQPDLHVAITRAVDRAARTITRRMGRSRRLAPADNGAPIRTRQSPRRSPPNAALEAS